MFALFLGHVRLADPSQFEDLRKAFLFRAGVMDDSDQLAFAGNVTRYSVMDYAATMGEHAMSLFLAPLLIAALAGLGYCAARLRTGREERYSVPFLLLAPAVIHSVVFSNAMYVHECLLLIYLPGLAAAAAIILDKGFESISLRDWRFVAAVFFLIVNGLLSVQRTAELYFNQYLDGWIVGAELAQSTAPDDKILVLGMPYHPAVEWYARRDVEFVGHRPVGTRAEVKPTLVAVLKDMDAYLAASTSADAGTAHFVEETRKSVANAERRGKVTATDHLTLYGAE